MRHLKDTFLAIVLALFAFLLIGGFVVMGYWFVYGEWPG